MGDKFVTEDKKRRILEKRIADFEKEFSNLEAAKDKVLQRSKFLDIVIESLPHPFYVIDANDYSIKLANSAALRGAPLENQTCYTLTHKRESPCLSMEHPCPLERVKKTGKPVVVEHIHYDQDNKPRHVEVYGFPIFDSQGNITEMIEYSLDITKRKQAEKKLAHMATHDSLTNLPNRSLFSIRFDLEMEHAKRDAKKIAVLLLDLDKFKNINDTLGHSEGDKLLIDAGNRLTSQVRKCDTVARMGGDEFLVLLSGLENEQDADMMAQKIVVALRKPFVIDGREEQISTSVGVVIYPDNGKDIDTLIKHADAAMYAVKDKGGDSYQRFTQ